jgi:hypothetical protein
VFHPTGVFAEGAIERVAPADAGLPVPPSARVVARLSKALGTPGALPDIVGLALRIVPQQDSENQWDVLLASAGSSPVGRAVGLRPVTSWTGKSLTSLAPLRYRDVNWWLRARIRTRVDGSGLSLEGVHRQLESGVLEVELDQAGTTSSFEPLARVTLTKLLTAPADREVSFDPVLHTARGVTLYPGWLARLRAHAYDQSREGRNAR